MKVAYSEKARIPGELFNRYLALLRGSESKGGVDVSMLRRLVKHTLRGATVIIDNGRSEIHVLANHAHTPHLSREPR
jgi:hypothetical protein